MRARLLGLTIAFALAASAARAGLPDDLCEGADVTAGTCAVFQKPAERGVWGDLYSRFFEPLGFRRSIAVVIGVSRYAGYPNLEAPKHDAMRVRDFLIQTGFDIVITLIDGAATKSRIEHLWRFTFRN